MQVHKPSRIIREETITIDEHTRMLEEKLFALIRRKPDSSNRRTSSEYKQRVFIWRDDVMDAGYQGSRD